MFGRIQSQLWLCAALLLCTAVFAKPRVAQDDPADSKPGAALYLNGELASGAPLVGTRAGAEASRGAIAACVNCHRRSGLGSQEGRNIIPPISGRYLFDDHEMAADEQLPYVPGERLDRMPYTEATLDKLLREGVDTQGRTLSVLMPRYALPPADLKSLIQHLNSLDRRKEPGVTSTELRFATIITPDADPDKKRGMLEVLEQFFQDRNQAPRGPGAQTMVTSGANAHVRSMFKVNRRWLLDVWELNGTPDTWQSQLAKKMDEQPVFAVLSGLSGKQWDPVANFCEQRGVPCLFPNVEEPPANADENFHTLYFSRGLYLEADLIAAAVNDAAKAAQSVTRVRIVYRDGERGAAAAAYLSGKLKTFGVDAALHALPRSVSHKSLETAVRVSNHETLILWLPAADLAALNDIPAPAGPVYLSGLLGGLDEAPLPQAWREHARMSYPVDLADRRRVRLDYALGWFRIRHIPVRAEQVQVDTYLACGLLSETLKHMVDAFVPDYLIERLEDTVEHRLLTGYYPRLALAPHQRFASKGGYLMRFDAGGRAGLVADGEWTTP